MPSPFPGMDPWLEDPGHWGNIHLGLIAAVQYRLNLLIRPRYLARVEERLYLVPDDDPTRRQRRVADIRVERRPGRKRRPTAGGTAVATRPMVVTTVFEDEDRERYIDVIELDTSTVVTTIEVISPSKKLAGSESRKQYLQKQRQVIDSPVNWVEFDLLRTGERYGWQAGLPSHEYLCYVSPARKRPDGLVWPFRLTERLPVVDIPLAGRDPPAKLDLQAVFAEGYERGSWDGAANYLKPPVPPLSPELDAWADALLREKGLR